MKKANSRQLTNDDVSKYEGMVSMYMSKFVVKNWNEASLSPSASSIMLGNTGMTIEDIRQQLMTEVCVALHNYNPEYRTPEGKSVLESTFVYQHLYFRVGQLMKRLTNRRYGYGVWMNHIDDFMKDGEES